MAEQGGSFAGFSSGVPTTGQMGQGLAQVFTPQAIGLDTSAVQRAGANIGNAIQQREAENRRKKALEQQRLNDIVDGADMFFPQMESLKQQSIDNYYKRVEQGATPEEAGRLLQTELSKVKNQNDVLKEKYKKAQTQTGEFKDAKYFDEEEGEYENPTEMFTPLMKPVEGDVDIDEWFMSINETYDPKRNENIIYNPQYTESDIAEAIADEIDRIKKNRGEEKLNRVYNDKTGQLIVQETLSGISDEDYNSAVQSLQQDHPEFLTSFMTTRLIEEGNAPSALGDKNAKDIYQGQYNSFIEETANRYRPQSVSTKTLKKPTDSDSGDGKPTVEYEISYGGAEEAELQGYELKQEPSILLGDVKVKGQNVVGLTRKQGKPVAIVTKKDDEGNIITKFDPDSSVIQGYRNEVKNRASSSEKPSVVNALGEFDSAKDRTVNIEPEVKELKGLLSDMKSKGFFTGGKIYSGDNEERVIQKLKEMGYDTETVDVESRLKDTDFSNEKDIESFAVSLIKTQPNVAARRIEKDAPKKSESGETKFKMSNGYEYTREQLKEAGWSDAQIDALKQ